MSSKHVCNTKKDQMLQYQFPYLSVTPHDHSLTHYT